MYANAPINAILFSCNDLSKKLISNTSIESEGAKNFLAGCLGGLASMIAMVPGDFLKCRA